MVGLLAAGWLNRRQPIAMRPQTSGSGQAETSVECLPPLCMALVPVLLPVTLISIATIYKTWFGTQPGTAQSSVGGWLALLGNANLAMVLAALFALYLCWQVQGHSLRQLADHVEDALLSGGVIILITAAGGAFGNLLAMAEIQRVVESLFAGGEAQYGGLVIMCVAFAIASLLKVAQGSSTVSMIIASSLVAPIAMGMAAEGRLGFHLAYLVPVIGAGSLMGSWMNDSGFWVFAKMGVLTEGETLRSWTILLCLLSVSSLAITLVMASLFPLV